jgi:putative ABC transport system substrate-binding protein
MGGAFCELSVLGAINFLNSYCETIPWLVSKIGGSMRRLIGLFGIFVTLAACGTVAQAQQPSKIPRVGWLTGGSLTEGSHGFLQGLRDLGYIEGKNIVIEWRVGEGKRDRIAELAADLVRLKVDVIITGSATDTRAAKAATTTIPIVMTNDGDPVGNGFVASLARPGGNITGLSTLSPELSGKRLELLKEIVPKLSRVAIFGTSTSASNAQEFKELDLAAGALGLKLQYFDVLAPKDIEIAFRSAAKERSQAVLMNISGGIMPPQHKEGIELSVKSRLLAIYSTSGYVEAGGLMSYGRNQFDFTKRAATFVDKILKGAKPADLPVEQPKKFELVINLKTAKKIGLTIPPNVLARADRVIR